MSLPRIAVLTQSLGSGGAERFVANLGSKLSDCGFHVSIVSFTDRRDYPLDRRATFHSLNHVGVNSTRRTLSRLASFLRDSKSDILISNGRYTGQFAGHACKNLNIKWISRLGNQFVNSRKTVSEFFGRLWYSCVIRHADVIVCNSRQGVEDISSRFPHVAARVQFIPNWCELPSHIATPGVTPGIRLLWVGRLVPGKRPNLFLRLIENLSPHFDIEGYLYGDGPMRKPLMREIRDSRLSCRVHLKGFSDDMALGLSQGDLLVFTSVSEGMPNVLLEAGAVGLPVVSTDCDFGPREILRCDACWETGVLVPIDDLQSLTKETRSLLNSRKRLRQMGRNARQHIERNFTCEQVFPAWLDLLSRVAER